MQKILYNFIDWMKKYRTLSQSTIEKYARAVNTVSNDMLEIGVINNSLNNMSVTELDLAISALLANY